MASRRHLRVAAVTVAACIYSPITAAAVIGNWSHYELLVLVLQFCLLLPALWYGLSETRPAAASFVPRFKSLWPLCLIALIVLAPVSWRISRGVMISDESSYRHEARILGSGRLFAAAPPGAADRPVDAPEPIRFTHEIVWRKGWYSKYPIGWPLVLAIPEKLSLGWLATPALGALLLWIAGAVAKEVYGPAIPFVAIALTALSPYFLANSVGRMSHALAAVIVSFATLACLEGIRLRRLGRFIVMFGLLIFGFHVRPFTTMVAAVVLGLSALWGVRKDRSLLIRVGAAGFGAAIVSVASVLVYNWVFTGNPYISPYALQRGTLIPAEIGASFSTIASNLVAQWRFAAQSTLIYAFPFVFLLAGYGFWITRKQSSGARILATLFAAMVLGHLVQFESSSSVLGERYWYEAYFCITVLAARGLVELISGLKTSAVMARFTLTAVATIQLVVLAASAIRLDATSGPRREVRQLAETYDHCHCVVFLEDKHPFYGQHLNLNGPEWKSADVFYAIDPGPSERDAWAARLGRREWVVLTYDPGEKRAEIDRSHLSGQ